MKILLAPNLHPDDGFNWCEPGELMMLPSTTCCRTESCGCQKAFIGNRTRKGSTIAEVSELATPCVIAALLDSYDRADLDEIIDVNEYHKRNLNLYKSLERFPIGTLLKRSELEILDEEA